MRNRKGLYYSKQHSAATLVFTLVLVTLSTLIILFAAEYGKLQDKSFANISRDHQAFEAAEAGLEFGINYLRQNDSTILATRSGGYVQPYSDSNTSNVSLANGSKYTITYSNPIASNYTLIKISSTGTSDDGSATRTASQLVQFGSILVNIPSVPLTSKQAISLGGNSEIINTYSNSTIQTGSTVSLGGSASTILNSGTSSTSGNIKSDISQNQNSISSQSDNSFFANFFGVAPSNVKGSMGHYYSNSSSTNYKSTLNGMSGTSIWIDQTGGTAQFNGNMTVGTPASPVLLIINGPVTFSGNVDIYGYVFILGDASTTLTGNVTIVGGYSSTGQVSATGSIQIVYSPSTLTNLQTNSSMKYYAKIPGSWKDY